MVIPGPFRDRRKTWYGGTRGSPKVSVPLGPIMAEVSGIAVGSGTAVAAGIACPELPELGAATGVLSAMAAAGAGASVAGTAGAAAGASPAVPQATAMIRAIANGAKAS